MTEEAATAMLPVLDWHPSEATALVVAAALGHRGQAEIRDKGLPVCLDDRSTLAWKIATDQALPARGIVDAIAATASLADLEAVFVQTFNVDEIDYERQKAAKPSTPEKALSSTDAERVVDGILAEAHSRGTQWLTHRRLREALSSEQVTPGDLRRQLVRRSVPPLIATGSS